LPSSNPARGVWHQVAGPNRGGALDDRQAGLAFRAEITYFAAKRPRSGSDTFRAHRSRLEPVSVTIVSSPVEGDGAGTAGEGRGSPSGHASMNESIMARGPGVIRTAGGGPASERGGSTRSAVPWRHATRQCIRSGKGATIDAAPPTSVHSGRPFRRAGGCE
jgi:hypothetical protein